MAVTLEKTPLPIKGNSTGQPARSMVQGAHGQVQIRPGTEAFGYVAPIEPEAPAKVVKVFATSEMVVVNKMRRAVEAMFDIMMRLPQVGFEGIRSQIGALSPSPLGEEPAAENPGAAPLAWEISLMEATFAALMFQSSRDFLGVKLVVGVALGIPWKRLLAEDPKRRSRQFLAYLRNNCLWHLAHSTPGQRAVGLVDNLPVYKVDKKRH